MPKEYGIKEKIMKELSELSPVDKALQRRAQWFLENTGMERYLVKDGRYLDVGTGKGHITERVLADMEQAGSPIKIYAGIDVADKPLQKVQNRESARQEKSGQKVETKNPMNYAWGTAESLPIRSESLDGVSYVFSIHHMDRERIDQAVEEAKRVIKKDGYIFIAEDLVDTDEEREVTEEVDRKLNWEGRDVEHNYKSDAEWEQYFDSKGLEIVERKFFESPTKKGTIKHGFYVLRLKSEQE